ncbi:MAG: AMP-binding protein, partial [bacterium]|nr:AMP-binding protein [bacterium]
QDYPFENLVEKVFVTRDLGRHPLFDVMFVFRDKEESEHTVAIEKLFGKTKFHEYEYENRQSKFDLTLTVADAGEQLMVHIQYCTRLFRKETIERIGNYFLKILDSFLEAPDRKLFELDIITEREKQQILVDFNGSRSPWQDTLGKTIPQVFEAQVRKAPDRVAAAYKNRHLTYRALNASANRLAQLLRNKGVISDTIVGFMSERSCEMIVGIMAILKAGGAYLPIDLQLPAARKKFMLSDSAVKVILMQEGLPVQNREALGNISPGQIVFIEQGNRTGQIPDVEITNHTDDLAYVIYTSGTTGNPKAVLIRHNSVINLVMGLKQRVYPGEEPLKVSLVAPYVFDASVKQIFASLLLGHALVIVPEEARFDAGELIRSG